MRLPFVRGCARHALAAKGGLRHAKGGQAARAMAEDATAHAITLTPEEKKLFDTLLAVCEHASLKTTMRAAGGWVRDKLLGKASKDIDIALDDMLGREFAEHINGYLRACDLPVHHIAVIASNPEQSKHLETAAVKVEGIDIDLVNLRAEDYTEDSRIPTMKFGTPLEDAMRRDLTINALFYNLATNAVEDYTGMGLADLDAGFIRTPLAPKETLLDDPLRALRAVRFAARYGFDLDPLLVEAMASHDVQTALLTKVSRERVGVEVNGMLKGGPEVFARAMRCMHDAQLIPAVFETSAVPQEARSAYAECARAHVEAATGALAVEPTLLHGKDDASAADPSGPEALDVRQAEHARLLMLASALMPLRTCTEHGVLEGSKRKKARPQAASRGVLLNSMKLRTKDADSVSTLEAQSIKLHAHLADLTRAAGAPDDQAARALVPDDAIESVGWAIKAAGEAWRVSIVLACIAGESDSPLADDVPVLSAPREAAAVAAAAAAAIRGVEGLGLASCFSWKPLLAGPAMMAELGLSKPGPEVGAAQKAATGWQFRHPDGTAAACAEWVRSTYAPSLARGAS